jgi:Ca2+-binding RTX toxin-like protein
VLFDHDGDGIKTGTGWVKADDGLLVWDRNGNGTIDNGGELFGVNTVLTNGQKAADGFAALRELDGNADGTFNSSDAAYASVKVWRDLNQDGISQSGELQSLSQAGIAALNLNATPTNIALPGNNQQFLTSSYTRTDGGTATLADINFADNPFYRAFTGHLDTTAVANLPDMQGSGRLRDLKEAATISTTLANQLADLQANYRTHDQYAAALDSLILNWANTSDWQTTPVGFQAPTLLSGGNYSGLPIAQTSPGLHLMQAPAILGGGQVPYAIIYQPDGITKEQLWGAYRVPLNGSAPPLPEKYLRAVYLIETLERYNGLPFINFNIETGAITNGAGQALPPEQAGGGSMQTYPIPVYVPISNAQLDLLEQSYTELKQSIGDGLVLQTRLKGYMDAIDLQIDATGIRLDFTGVETLLNDRQATDAKVAYGDLVDLIRAQDNMLIGMGWTDSVATLRSWTEAVASDPTWTATLAGLRVNIVNGVFTGGSLADTLVGQTGADTLWGREGNDLLLGGEGNDTLYGENGDDMLEGGAGTDFLMGGVGSDTYLFGKGDGQDRLYATNDATVGKIDTLQFKPGVLPSEVQLSTSGTSLVIKIAGTTDQVTADYFLYQDNPLNSYNPLQQIKFADGTTWDTAGILAQVFAGTSGADITTGTTAADTINGQGGNDTLYGRDGNDTLQGGEGNDTLYGENGDDMMEGGTGNDFLMGGVGSDTYLFGKGDGQDRLYATNDATAGKIDTLQFKPGVMPDEITFATSGTSLVIKIAGTTDQITADYFLYQDNPLNSYNPLQRIQFADGTTWYMTTIQAKLYGGTESADWLNGTLNADTINGLGGNDTLYGRAGDDMLDGGAGVDSVSGGDGNDTVLGRDGNDYLYGENGNDMLDGGLGTDSLVGGAGNDTYILGRGYGADSITENDSTAGNTDLASFLAGVATDQIWFRHVGNNLEASIIGTSDKLTLTNWYSGAAYHVEQFKTADNHTLLDTKVEALVQAMAAFSPPTAGQTTLPSNYQTALAPVIAANWQ